MNLFDSSDVNIDKCEKWGLNTMTKPNSYSLETNITIEEKRKDVLMIYLHENKLIFNPWNGTILNN
jgi:hypothetical protein